MELRPLSELTDWELVDRNQDLRGKPVFDDSGKSLGAISELLVDTDQERVASVRTETGWLIPIDPLEIRGSAVIFHDRHGSVPECCGPVPVTRQFRTGDHVQLATGKRLRHSSVEATDGEIGSLNDIYFDDRSWRVRYLVIDTSRWLFGRKVLISPEAIISEQSDGDRIRLNLTRDQIRNSPPSSTDPPVSKQYQGVLHNYYGWGAVTNPPSPAMGAPIVAAAPYDVAVPPAPIVANTDANSSDFDAHLRSMKEVIGYEIVGKDASLGHVGDFAFEPGGRRIHALIVYTDKASDEITVMVPVNKIVSIDWPGARVEATLSRRDVSALPGWTGERS